MAATPPDGEPVPLDGALPDCAHRYPPAGQHPMADFGLYIHVPYCRVRCGYCDFNTYTPDQVAAGSADTYLDVMTRELHLAQRVLRDAHVPDREISTIFIGGGTPTLLPAADLAAMVQRADSLWGLAAGAEVTTEANPDTLDEAYAQHLAQAGFTRVSVGMQSSVTHVLQRLDRTHRPENVQRAVQAAQSAGLQVSVDLIYGTPGESLADWRSSLQAAIDLEPDHISAYALVIEGGTAMAAAVRRGQLPDTDGDDLADKYELTDELLSAAGFQWYEVSNFSRGESTRCRHNLAYWRSSDWWGIGPGAHSHVAGVRWWNVRHPRRYEELLVQGHSPAQAREVLTPAQQRLEELMLRIRLRSGGTPDELGVSASAVSDLADQGLLELGEFEHGRIVLSLRGRLLADAVVRQLSESGDWEL